MLRLFLLFGWLVAVVAAPAIAEPWQSQMIRLQKEIEGEEPPVITAMDVHPSGRFLAVAGDDHLIRIWDIKSDVLVGRLAGHTDWVRAVAFAPDGTLASGGNDHRVMLWSIDSREKVAELPPLAEAVSSLKFNDDGKKLAVAGFQSQIAVYDVDARRQSRTVRCGCVDMRGVTFSPDGNLMAAAGRNGKIEIYASDSGERIFSEKLHTRRARAVAFSADGKELYSAGEDRKLIVIDVDALKVARSWNTGGAKVMSLLVTPSGMVATGSSDNSIRLWDANTGELAGMLKGHTGSIGILCQSDDKLISGSFDTTVRVWSDANAAIAGNGARIESPTSLDGADESQPATELRPAQPSTGLWNGQPSRTESVPQPTDTSDWRATPSNPIESPAVPAEAPAWNGSWNQPETPHVSEQPTTPAKPAWK